MIVDQDRTRGDDVSREPLSRSFFDRPVLEVAPDLLGRTLVRNTVEGPIELRLTEVEAYAGEVDPGSHAFRGRTRRNASMFGPPGHAYVYFIYGMWWNLNLVCGPEDHASGVLLRGAEVMRGTERAWARRPKARKEAELAQGPARLATALGIDRELDGADVCGEEPVADLGILTGRPMRSHAVRTGPRTGVGGDGAAYPWRYWLDGEPTVSPYRPHKPRRRGAAT